MRYTKTERAEAILAIALIAWAAFFLLLTTTQIQHYDSDIFWALRSGQWIAGHWRVPVTDPFSYTFSGKPWVDFTWGFQLIAHLFYSRLGGWTGLYILQLLLTIVTFGAVYFNLRLLTSRRLWLMALLFLLTLACSFQRLFIRPHLFGFLFISLYLLLLNSNDRRDAPWFVFIILPLQIFWVNIHSSAILGVFIVWAYASGEFLDAFIREGFKGFKGVVSSKKRLLILALILPFVTLLNPYGLKLAIFPFIHQGGVNADALRHISEWSRLPWKQLFFYLYPVPLSYFAFRFLFYISLLSLGLNWRRLKTRDLMLFGGAAYMGISHVRWVGQFAFFAAPIIAFNIAGYLEGKRGDSKTLRRSALGLALIVSVFIGLIIRDVNFRSKLGIGVLVDEYPVGTLKFMRDNKLKGNIYNSYLFGGYLIFNYPELKVFIDGRTPTVYSPNFFWKSRHTQNGKDWERLVEEYGITIALVKLGRPNCKVLYKSKGWTPVVFDDISVLYLRSESGYEDIIKKHGLSFSPCSGAKKYVLPEGKKERLRMKKGLVDVIRSIGDGEEGNDFAYPHRLLGLLESHLEEKGHKERAVSELEAAVRIKKYSPIFYDLGVALGKLKRYDEAITAFRTSINLKKDFKPAYLGLGLIYFDTKDYKNSAIFLSKYVRLADDKAKVLGLKSLGRSYFRQGKLGLAEEMFKRAEFLASDKKARGEVQYYLGNTLFEAGRFGEGALYYSRAMANDKRYKKVLENLLSRFKDGTESKKVSALRAILKND